MAAHLLLYAIGVVSAAQLGLVPPLVPTLQRDLGMSLASAGLAVSVVTLIGAVFGLPAGGWSDRIGHAPVPCGSASPSSAGVGRALCRGRKRCDALIGRGLAGVGYLLVVVAGPSLIAATAEPRHHPFTLSLWGTFVPVGIALAGLGTASLMGHWDWRQIFLLDAGLLALALVAAALSIRPPSASQPPAVPASLAMLRPSVPMATAFFCFALLFLAVAGLLPEYLVDRRGLSPAAAGHIAAIVTAFGIAGSLLASEVMRRGVRPGLLAAAGMLSSTAIAALCLSSPLPLSVAVAGFALSFALGGLVPAAAFASVPLVADDARAIGPINGLIAQAGSLGSLAGPPLLAMWAGMAGWSTSAVPLLAIAAVGSGCALAAATRRN